MRKRIRIKLATSALASFYQGIKDLKALSEEICEYKAGNRVSKLNKMDQHFYDKIDQIQHDVTMIPNSLECILALIKRVKNSPSK